MNLLRAGNERIAFWSTLWVLCGGCSTSPPQENWRPGRLVVSESIRDVENRHPNVVRVTAALNGKVRGRCSGILMGPRLVLTAGHCVCAKRPDGSAGGLIIDSSTCAANATVKTVTYSSKEGVEDDAPSVSEVFKGVVRPHPRLKIRIDAQGVISGHADLALIHLEEAVKGVRPARMANAEVVMGEDVLMVGYGYDQRVGGFDGERRSGRNQVATFMKGGATFFVGKPLEVARPVMPGGSIVVREAGAYMLEGDSGGPCFRVSDGALIGIAMTTSHPPLDFSEFTSTFYFREWLKEALERAEESG